MEATPPLPHLTTSSRAWFGTTIAEFLRMESDIILGRLATQSDFTVLPAQRDSWLAQITLLKSQLVGLGGSGKCKVSGTFLDKKRFLTPWLPVGSILSTRGRRSKTIQGIVTGQSSWSMPERAGP